MNLYEFRVKKEVGGNKDRVDVLHREMQSFL